MEARDLSERVSFPVLEPGDDGFDAARSVFNGRFDRRPHAIAQPRDADEVATCVAFAREHGIALSIKSGGHSYAGRTVADGGLLVELSRMRSIDVDPEARTVTVEAGCTIGDLDAATQAHGLATPTPSVSTVGVAGAALGGGTGYLSRKHGLMLDNLLAAELVTAAGELIRTSEEEDPELFWALRGAGANFGVVTSLTFRLHEVGPEVFAGFTIYPFERAPELLAFYREFVPTAPVELQALPVMAPLRGEGLPEELEGRLACSFMFFHTDPEQAEVAGPLREQGGALLDVAGPQPYVTVQQLFDPDAPSGFRYYSRAHYLDELNDAAIDTIATHVPQLEGDLTMSLMEPRWGAQLDVPASATAFPERDAPLVFQLLGGWEDPADDEGVMRSVRTFHEAMGEHARGGVHVNYLGDDEASRVPAAYGDHYARLAQLKAEWDPDNLFRTNHNIEPRP